ncbi:23S rRNA (guanosine(2251)-2'-O)-methyltransferase RlmB [Methylolobus aquaticus]|nr:23S rRNA (guanosine(2251)-2'-O)-methyltransferase RlmB [Methylolobus aquaticus]
MKQVRRVFGLHAAESALQQHGGVPILAAYFDAQRHDARLGRLAQALDAAGIAIERVARGQLDRMAGGGNHQGVVLELNLPVEQGEEELFERLAAATASPLLLVLDQVQDPHNLGACLRTADASGCCGVVVPKDQAVGLTATVAKVASGAAETVPVYRVTNLARCLDRLKGAGLWIVGASGRAEKTLHSAELTGPLAVVLGAEGRGLRRLTEQKCDFLVRIPMAGSVESLNVSVAAGVLLYEAVRQRSAQSSVSGR